MDYIVNLKTWIVNILEDFLTRPTTRLQCFSYYFSAVYPHWQHNKWIVSLDKHSGKMLAKQCWHLKFIASIKVLWVFCIFKRMSKQFLFLYSMLIPFTENLEINSVMRSSATVHPGLIPSFDGSDAASCRKPSHPSREVTCPQHSCLPVAFPSLQCLAGHWATAWPVAVFGEWVTQAC